MSDVTTRLSLGKCMLNASPPLITTSAMGFMKEVKSPTVFRIMSRRVSVTQTYKIFSSDSFPCLFTSLVLNALTLLASKYFFNVGSSKKKLFFKKSSIVFWEYTSVSINMLHDIKWIAPGVGATPENNRRTLMLISSVGIRERTTCTRAIRRAAIRGAHPVGNPRNHSKS